MQRKRIFCLVAVGFLAAGAVGVSVQSASAAPRTYASTVVAQTARTAAVPAFACGWTPANNSNVSAGFNEDGVNIRTGGSTSCAIRGEGFTGQSVIVRCDVPEGPDNHFWFYLTDQTTGITGWVRNDLVGFPSMPVGIQDC